MNKTLILLILGFLAPMFLAAYGQADSVDSDTIKSSDDSGQQNPLEYVLFEYENEIRFKDIIPVAIGILAFSYFIWKTSYFLSKREVFAQKHKYTASGTQSSFRQKRIFYVVKYIVFFPIILYGWVVISFFFMWTLNTSLSIEVLTLIMVGIVSASRIAAHWNEKLAEDIMKFLPFNLMFTFLLNPYLDFDKIIEAIHNFPPIMLGLTVFIVYIGVLEGILKLTHFVLSKNRRPSGENLPIKSD